jgi:hypothetical protein
METLLADIAIEVDGGTLDPAAWDDWIACVREVKRVRDGGCVRRGSARKE